MLQTPRQHYLEREQARLPQAVLRLRLLPAPL
jgi:hypothetical protein